ncbi:hypothetical protein QYM36_015896 [Artemia franciscana]|uniref:Oxidoreductase HTATIP2 n=2 Tax=Artemia franciscana TaxID=6661 RepID=A0AA88H602_ARTSF|nr:hypothetical protein QYM36_015896 [Artemia franciscana]KAK2705670.1 hypothetical protein QYM36_015896 [Artemia franciscana]KAK2705671.1 hypothetical protein QYM36_015896 [Artemia franciscana]
MKAFIVGSTGEVGKEVLRSLAAMSIYSSITAFNRRLVEYQDEELKQRITQKVIDFDNINKDDFQGFDAGFCTLGTTRGKAGVEGFVKVDYDYVMHVARAAKDGNCQQFHFASSKGASANSMFLYTKTKGRVEEDLKILEFPRLCIYRPGLLICQREESRPLEAITRALSKFADFNYWWSIPTSMVAKAMVANSLKEGKSVELLEQSDIIKLARNSN